MAVKFDVTLNKTTLNTEIICNSPESSVFNKISLRLSTVSDDLEYFNTGFRLNWHLFLKEIRYLGKIIKNEGADIEFDEFSTILIKKYVDDNKSRYHHTNQFQDVDIHKILQKDGFERILTNEQIRDTHKLLAIKHGANFSVPGAGKTTTLLAVHSILRNIGLVNSLFVISPVNAFISWENEIADIYKDSKRVIRLRVEDLYNFSSVVDKLPFLILVNYEKLRKDVNRLFPYFMQSKVHLVLDESHRIKSGYDNLSFKQIIQLSDLAIRRDILSGTPMPQHVNDLSPQFEYLWCDDLIADTINLNTEEEKVNKINSSIKHLYVRTTKKELGLKDPIIKYESIEMGPIQSQLYRLFKSEAARLFSGMDKNSRNYYRSVGRSVVRLLQAATNPMLLGVDDEYFEHTQPIPYESEAWELLSEFSKYEKAAKLVYLQTRVEAILKDNPSNKIVIWSYFIRNILLLERIFIRFNPAIIYGGIPTSADVSENNREWMIRKFHEDKSCRLMIANPQAGGEGISLHKVCHHAIYLDRNFNAAHFLQSLDRIHRLGLDKTTDTNVEILVAKDTIDEILIKRLSRKTSNMGKVLNDPYLITLAYDPEDIPYEDNLGLDREDIIQIEDHIKK